MSSFGGSSERVPGDRTRVVKENKNGEAIEMGEFEGKNNHEVTAKLAYELWEQRGCPLGSPEIDWLAAEQALQHAQTGLALEDNREGERSRAASS